MKARTLATQDHGETAGEILKKIVEECEMKATNAITTLNNWLSQGLVRKTPGKVLGALAVGALMLTAAVVTPSSAFADEPSRPLGIEASQGFGSIHDMAINAALLDAKQTFRGDGSIDDMAQAALLNTKLDTRLHTNGIDFVEDSPARTSKLDTRLYTNGIDFVEDNPVRATKQDTWLHTNGIDFVDDSPARTSKQDTRLYTNGIDFVEDSPALTSKLDTRLYTNGIDFVEDSPARATKQDTRLYTNGIDFVEEPGVGKVSYAESAGFGPLSDMIAAAELSSARGGDYIFWADFPN